jgi:hypothetical protein
MRKQYMWQNVQTVREVDVIFIQGGGGNENRWLREEVKENKEEKKKEI